jgi:hypothetical protein
MVLTVGATLQLLRWAEAMEKVATQEIIKSNNLRETDIIV